MTNRPFPIGLLAVRRAKFALLVLLIAGLAAAAVFSFQFNMGYDAVQMLYYGRLIGQRGFVPYRDIFEFNLPGGMLAFTAIDALIDYSNRFLLRYFDLVYLTAISLATWRWLRPLGRSVASGAVALFGVAYLLGGPVLNMQREYIFLLPVVMAVAVSTSTAPIPDTRRAFFVGLLCGLATTIKPHAAIGLLPILVYHYFAIVERQGGHRPSIAQCARILFFYALGGLIPVAAALAYLVLSGGFSAWLAIVTNYWPLYSTLTDQMDALTGAERASYIVGNLLGLGGRLPWLIPVAVGAVTALRPGALSPRGRRRVWLMLALLACYIAYPAITGQFYPQHWLPMIYFIMAASALCFLPAKRPTHWLAEAAPLVALILALGLTWGALAGGAGQIVDYFVFNRPPPPNDGDRGAEIADYLESHLQPGDTVQPIDQVGYALHGMLLARAEPATRFQADAEFYIEPSLPYVQDLRAEFISALRRHPPRFIIDVVARSSIQTEHTVTPFAELDQLLRDDYDLAYLGHGFLIYEHVSGARPGLVIYPTELSGATAQDLAAFKDDLTAFSLGKPAANPQALGHRLDALVAAHDHIFLENLGDEAQSGAALESWLTENTIRVSEQQYVSTRVIEYLSPRVGCPPAADTAFQFGREIRVSEAGAGLVKVGGDSYGCVTLTMASLQPLARPYVISVHILDGAGRIAAQYDSQPRGNLYPTTSWTPGQPVTDRFAILLPQAMPPGDYAARLFIYDAETHANLLLGDGSASALIGSISIP